MKNGVAAWLPIETSMETKCLIVPNLDRVIMAGEEHKVEEGRGCWFHLADPF